MEIRDQLDALQAEFDAAKVHPTMLNLLNPNHEPTAEEEEWHRVFRQRMRRMIVGSPNP